MTNLSKGLRDQLKERYELITLQIVDVRISQIDGTRKYLFGLPDGHIIESVLMKYKHGNSVWHLLSGGMPYGVPFLCFYIGWTGEKSAAIRDVRPDLPDPDRSWGEGL